jgi:hypothetical protein
MHPPSSQQACHRRRLHTSGAAHAVAHGVVKLHGSYTGTQSFSEQVLLSINEVESARQNRENMALFVVSEIEVVRREPPLKCAAEKSES